MISLNLFDFVLKRGETLIDFGSLILNNPDQIKKIDLSLWYRYHLLLAGIKMVFNEFPIGIGWENFRYKVPQYSSYVMNYGPHNTYIGLIAEIGLFGLFAITWFIGELWRSASWNYKVIKDEN